MRILIVDDDRATCESTAIEFELACAGATILSDEAWAPSLVTREEPEAIVIRWRPSSASALANIRVAEGGRRSHVVALIDDAGQSIKDAVAAGVDDFIRLPVSREELSARVGRSHAKPLRDRGPVSEVPRSAATMHKEGLRQLFDRTGEFLGVDLGSLLGDASVRPGFLVMGDLNGASIPMSVPGEQMEIRVSVLIEQSKLPWFTGTLLGDENAPLEAAKDMLRELANTAGGSVKRAGELQGLELTTGIPVNEAAGTPQSEMTHCWTLSLDGGARFTVVCDVQTRGVRRLSIANTREGMVTALDLKDGLGAVLVPVGTRLTRVSIKRLTDALGSDADVDVLEGE